MTVKHSRKFSLRYAPLLLGDVDPKRGRSAEYIGLDDRRERVQNQFEGVPSDGHVPADNTHSLIVTCELSSNQLAATATCVQTNLSAVDFNLFFLLSSAT